MGFCNCWAKCCSSFGFRKYSSRICHRNIVLLLIGLDNSGKSSTVNGLVHDIADPVPTVGFNSVRLKHQGYSVIIYDLGGGPQIRDIWPRYYIDVHGVIYVVDASDTSRIEENKEILKALLINENIAGKPLLLLANKQDKKGALDELDIVDKLQIESIVNQQRCPTLVETCSAAKRKLDPGILNGYRWLLRRIINDYEYLNGRVIRDTEEQNKFIEETRRKWKIKNRELCQVDDIQEDIEYCSPFKPINMVVKQLEDSDGHSHVVIQPLETNSLNGPPRMNAVAEVKEKFQCKKETQRKKQRKIRNNRTSPLETLVSKILPPLQQHPLSACSWARPSAGESENPPKISEDQTDITTRHESSDSEDVMVASK